MKRFYWNLAALCVLLLSAFGCSVDGETGMISPDPAPEAPELLSLEVVSRTKLDFEFSVPVRVLSLSFDPSLEVASVGEGRTVRVHLEQGLEPGMPVVADILAQDERGNAFSESVIFEKEAPPSPTEEGDNETTTNETPKDDGAPELLVTELRTESSAARVEFVEFRMLSPGNLGGLRVFVYRSGSRTPTEFEFPSTRVEAGEYVVLFLRTVEGASADVSPAAHNFWVPGSSSRLNKTGAVYVLDSDDRALAAVMISESPDPAWWEGSSRGHFAGIAEFLFGQGVWKSAGGEVATPADAVISSGIGTAVTRSISRDETVDNTGTSADWYVTANNGATPGMPNDPRRLDG